MSLLKFLLRFKPQKQDKQNMDNFSQEHLDKLLNRQKYLREIINAVNKKFRHTNWSMLHDFGVPATTLARNQVAEELVRVSMEIDFLTLFLKD